MGFNFAAFLRHNRSSIIDEWVVRLNTEVGEQYNRRPREELYGTVSEAFDANYHLLINNDFSYINHFINKITTMRLDAGFLLSDVQKAFELYREIVPPVLANVTSLSEYHRCMTGINRCLGYTIHRFSEYFQEMHQRKILEYNRELEREVQARTAELIESERKYKTLVEEINDGYFVIQDEVIVFANQAFCRMHGYRFDDVIGSRFYRFVDPENREKVMDIYKKGLTTPSASRVFEYKRLTNEGESFPTEILARTTRYENRLSNIGICRDITERVKMEKRVREAERMAYVGEITASLSHEIRNPLSAVNMNLQILKKNPMLRGNDQRRIDISVREVSRLERILKQLLDFAKPLRLEFKPCRINDILSLSSELLEMKLHEREISIIWSLDKRMPAINADGEKLEQAFINLILNAMEASPGGGRIWVESLYVSGGRGPVAEVTIKDEGPGITEDHVSEVFNPFFTTKTRGTGLGLSNAKRILEAHGGSIKLGKPGERGASFLVSLNAGGMNGPDSGCR